MQTARVWTWWWEPASVHNEEHQPCKQGDETFADALSDGVSVFKASGWHKSLCVSGEKSNTRKVLLQLDAISGTSRS